MCLHEFGPSLESEAYRIESRFYTLSTSKFWHAHLISVTLLRILNNYIDDVSVLILFLATAMKIEPVTLWSSMLGTEPPRWLFFFVCASFVSDRIWNSHPLVALCFDGSGIDQFLTLWVITLYSCIHISTFRRNMLPPSSGLKCACWIGLILYAI
jgi:hypothetical protein